MEKSKSFIAIPPGETIKEQLDIREMSQKEFASRMEMSEKQISKLINAKSRLTPDVANKLEMVLGMPAIFWSRLESIYRDTLVKVKEENNMEDDINNMKKFPYKEMANKGWLDDEKRAEDRVIALRKFFETVSLDSVFKEDLIPKIAYRRQSITEKSYYSNIAWIQKAKIDSRNIDVSKLNTNKLRDSLDKIRSMTVEKPSVFYPKIVSELASCGIAFVLIPHLKGSFLNGATFLNSGNNKVVIALTNRGKSSDIFWFSLFHEIGHILLGHLEKEEILDEDELLADKFSSSILISDDDFHDFIKLGDFSKESIVKFSDGIGLAPGIVVGRLQKENLIGYNVHMDLKEKYEL